MGDSQRAGQLASALPLLTILALIFAFLRIHHKHRHNRPLGWDGYTLMVSWVFLLVSLVLVLAAVVHGYGQHISEIRASIVQVTRLIAASQCFATGAAALSKTSIAITVLRLATERWHRIFIWNVAVSVNIFIWGGAVFVCVAIWDRPDVCEAGKHLFEFAVISSVWSAITDLIFAMLPWLVIRRLKLRKAEEMAVGVVMALGIASAITAAIRTTQLRCQHFTTDATYDSVPLVISTFAEPAVIIMAASVPFSRLLVRDVSSMAFQRSLPDERTAGRNFIVSHRPRSSHSVSSFSQGRFGRPTCSVSCTGGPMDPNALSRTLWTQDGAIILRTCEFEVEVAPRQAAWGGPRSEP
ncbi:hypothetical protein VTK56DRAFT_6510 [Thermocarpiscus australiensis]